MIKHLESDFQLACAVIARTVLDVMPSVEQVNGKIMIVNKVSLHSITHDIKGEAFKIWTDAAGYDYEVVVSHLNKLMSISASIVRDQNYEALKRLKKRSQE